jgi:hypothetical protein
MFHLIVFIILGLVALRLQAADGAKVFTTGDGSLRITYVDRIPAKPAMPKLGLVVLFHGNTHNESTLMGGTSAALEQAGIADHYVIVGLKSIGPAWSDQDDAPVTAFIRHAITAYPIDRRRIIGMGFSAGCWYVTRYVQAHPELFAGGIGYVGGQSGGPSKRDPLTVPPLYWVAGQKDTLQSVQEPRAQALRNLALGLPVIYREERDMGHDFLWGQSGADALTWMQTLRAKEAEVEADDAAFIAGFADDPSARRLLGQARTWMRVVLIGGPLVAPIVLQGLDSDNPTVQVNAATACARVPISDDIAVALGGLVLGRNRKVKDAALTAVMIHAGWNQARAQRVLCEHVLASTTAPEDRRAIVLALGRAVRIDLLGAFLYRRMLWTLVDLLDDRDAGVRQGAFQGLEPAMTGGFGYRPGDGQAARAPAVKQWRAWLEERCGPRPMP